MSAAWPLLLALFTFAPSVPSPKASQLSPILLPIHTFHTFLSSTHISFDLLSSLLVIPTYLTLAHKGLGSGWSWGYLISILLVGLNTYVGIRSLLAERPFNIFGEIPLSTSSSDLLAIYPPGSGNKQLDDLLIRLANIETRRAYVRFGHETMINAPTLGSTTIVYGTYLSMQLPSYIIVAGLIAILTSLHTPLFHANPSQRPQRTTTGKSTTKAWLMISLLLIFCAEVYWTTNTPIEALSSSGVRSYFSKSPRIEVQPPIYEIARTVRIILFLFIVPAVQYLIFGPPPSSIGSFSSHNVTGNQAIEVNTGQVIRASANALNQILRKLHHVHTLQRVAVTQPGMTARWIESAKPSAILHREILSSPSLHAAAASTKITTPLSGATSSTTPTPQGNTTMTLEFIDRNSEFRMKIREGVNAAMRDLRSLLCGGSKSES